MIDTHGSANHTCTHNVALTPNPLLIFAPLYLLPS